VRHVKAAIQTALDAIRLTVTTCRSIFQRSAASSPSLIEQALERIQSDSADLSSSAGPFPPQLQLTTQSLLMTLPSSSHFNLFPPNLRSYKPYIDLNSSSLAVPHDQISRHLDEWFRESCANVRVALERWFVELHSAKEVWSVRLSVRKWIHATFGLTEPEVQHVRSILDDVCKQRIIAIWKITLSRAETLFQKRLEVAAQDGPKSTIGCSRLHLCDSRLTCFIDISPSEFLFTAIPLPNLRPISGLPPLAADASLTTYKSALRRKLDRRTPALSDLLNALEDCADVIQKDRSEVLVGTRDDTRQLHTLRNHHQFAYFKLCTRILISQLTEMYQPHANSFCAKILAGLKDTIDGDQSEPGMPFFHYSVRCAHV